jgi:hypothetical protein
MVTLFATTLITCSQAIGIVNRLQQIVGLSYTQKTEIIREIRKVIPSCPIQIVEKKK